MVSKSSTSKNRHIKHVHIYALLHSVQQENVTVHESVRKTVHV